MRCKVIVKGNLADAAGAAATHGLRFDPTSYTSREQIGYVETDNPDRDRFLIVRVQAWFAENPDTLSGYPVGSLLHFEIES